MPKEGVSVIHMEDHVTKKLFVDLEASSLSRKSHPIEIAWGSSLDDIESYLISPRNIEEWSDWSTDSEEMHGIDRATLMERGAEPSAICSPFIRACQGCEVYTNNPCWDSMWLYKLFFFSDQDVPSMDVRHFDELLSNTVCPNTEKRVEGLYACLDLKRKVGKEMRKRHRAATDVEYLIRVYHLAKDMATTAS
ncbi:MAG: hypothetical protein SWQ30_11015 [Thermodesulfobacteriota bacterium]|nr:hypothetical protein [Thermodesulfobacteriota bacterium]